LTTRLNNEWNNGMDEWNNEWNNELNNFATVTTPWEHRIFT